MSSPSWLGEEAKLLSQSQPGGVLGQLHLQDKGTTRPCLSQHPGNTFSHPSREVPRSTWERRAGQQQCHLPGQLGEMC